MSTGNLYDFPSPVRSETESVFFVSASLRLGNTGLCPAALTFRPARNLSAGVLPAAPFRIISVPLIPEKDRISTQLARVPQRATIDRPNNFQGEQKLVSVRKERTRGTIRFHRKASAAKALAESSRPQGGKNRISCGFLLESDMEKYRFIHVSWKGPTGGRKDAGYGCQRAAWMEADFFVPCKSDKKLV